MPTPTFASGHDLVGRYRIVELLGVGHTAEVYLADDLSLRRPVVVKVLLAHLAAHEDVRRAFRDRIVRSATLSHPHLERVFDGGQESGSIFTITEYLSGGTLEDVLGAGRRLEPDDAARLGRDVSGAIAYLHANGFVHGALSPRTLLFDDEGRVRVTDVALSGLGGMHGEQFTYDEVRYLSPEQALGEPVGEKSDVYALALILFEVATGSSPFEAMTPEAMLRSRINSPLPVHPELGTLDMLLAQAAVADPRPRLDAEQFALRLSGASSNGAPLSLLPVRNETPLLAQFTPPELRTSVGFRPPSPDQIVGTMVGAPVVGRSAGRGSGASGATYAMADEPIGLARGPRRDLDDFSSRPTRRRRAAFAAAAVLLVLVAVAAGAVWKFGLLTPTHTVPSLSSLTLKEAAQVLKNDNDGFTLIVTQHVHSSSVPANQIVSQVPAPGISGKPGLAISVTLSDGPVMVSVPANVVGEDCPTATARLAPLHLVAQCPSSASVHSATVPVGRVVRVVYRHTTNPARVPRGSTLILVLSTGTGTTTSAPGAGSTTTTSPGATTTTTTVAKNLVAMPNVVGFSRTQVDAAMKAAGLYYVTRGPNANTSKWTTVVSSVPTAGTMVKRLTTVTLNVK